MMNSVMELMDQDMYKASYTTAENEKFVMTATPPKRVISNSSDDEELCLKYNKKKTKILVISSEEEVNSNNSVCNSNNAHINECNSSEDIGSEKISKKKFKSKKKKKKTEIDCNSSVVSKADNSLASDSDVINNLNVKTKKFQFENFVQRKRYRGLKTKKNENVKENQLKLCSDYDLSPHINWAVNTIRQYHQRNVYENYQVKEQHKMKKIKIKYKRQEVQSYESNNLKVLDIGSLDNPFSKFWDLNVTAIDLHPANENVMQCDFLDLKVNHLNAIDFNLSDSNIISAPEDYFDVIIFSKGFENIPSPKQRFLACRKAYRLLKTNGILCILNRCSKSPTIDSKDSGYIYYLLKITLGFLGFEQTKYASVTEFHPMTFRKGICSAVWTQDALIQLDATRKRTGKVLRNKFGKSDTSILRDEIYIPKDVEEKEVRNGMSVVEAMQEEDIVERKLKRAFDKKSSNFSIKEENEIKEASKHYLRMFLSSLEYNILPIQNIGVSSK